MYRNDGGFWSSEQLFQADTGMRADLEPIECSRPTLVLDAVHVPEENSVLVLLSNRWTSTVMLVRIRDGHENTPEILYALLATDFKDSDIDCPAIYPETYATMIGGRINPERGTIILGNLSEQLIEIGYKPTTPVSSRRLPFSVEYPITSMAIDGEAVLVVSADGLMVLLDSNLQNARVLSFGHGESEESDVGVYCAAVQGWLGHSALDFGNRVAAETCMVMSEQEWKLGVKLCTFDKNWNVRTEILGSPEMDGIPLLPYFDDGVLNALSTNARYTFSDGKNLVETVTYAASEDDSEVWRLIPGKIAASPDRTLVFRWESHIENRQERIIAIDVNSGETKWIKNGRYHALAVSHDNETIVAVSSSGNSLINLDSAGKTVAEHILPLGYSLAAEHMEFSRDGKYLAVSTSSARVSIWYCPEWLECATWSGSTKKSNFSAGPVGFLENGKLILAAIPGDGRKEAILGVSGYDKLQRNGFPVEGFSNAYPHDKPELLVLDLDDIPEFPAF